MLVLTRKLNEQIRVGENVTITILRVKGNTVRVGIEAPRDVRVVRGELPQFDSESEDGAPQEQAAELHGEAANEEVEDAPLAAFTRKKPRTGGKNALSMLAGA